MYPDLAPHETHKGLVALFEIVGGLLLTRVIPISLAMLVLRWALMVVEAPLLALVRARARAPARWRGLGRLPPASLPACRPHRPRLPTTAWASPWPCLQPPAPCPHVPCTHAACSPPLRPVCQVGTPLTWQQVAFSAVGGLRGALALILAQTVLTSHHESDSHDPTLKVRRHAVPRQPRRARPRRCPAGRRRMQRRCTREGQAFWSV